MKYHFIIFINYSDKKYNNNQYQKITNQIQFHIFMIIQTLLILNNFNKRINN